MRRFFAGFLLALPLLLFASPALAQLPRIFFGGSYGSGPDGIRGDLTFHVSSSIELMTGAPYSGEEEGETLQTLPNGTHINRKSQGRNQKVWRDSEGRVRIEEPLGRGQHALTLTEIRDPITGYIYILDSPQKIAHRVKVSVVPQRNADPLLMPRPPVQGGGGGAVGAVASIGTGTPAGATAAEKRIPPQISGPEDLGAQTIDGVSVHGSRITTLFPTGAEDNDGPFTTTQDSWYSSDLNMVIRSVRNDPRSGTQTTGIGNLSRSEPERSLFTIPGDYTIVDENSTFTIKWDIKPDAKQQ